MLIKRKLVGLLFVVTIFLSTSSVHAQWYIGADLIPSSNFYQLDSLGADEPVPAGEFDYQDDGLKIYSGFKTRNNFSLELEYKNRLQFGVGDVFADQEIWLNEYRDDPITSKSLRLSGQRTFDLTPGKYLYLRGGLYNWDLNTSDLKFNEEGTLREGTDLFYSIGAAFDFSETFGFKAEWERFAVDEEEVDLISTEFRFSF